MSDDAEVIICSYCNDIIKNGDKMKNLSHENCELYCHIACIFDIEVVKCYECDRDIITGYTGNLEKIIQEIEEACANIPYIEELEELCAEIKIIKEIEEEDANDQVQSQEQPIENVEPIPDEPAEPKEQEQEQEQEMCNICGDNSTTADNPIITTSCKHTYHYECLKEWFKNYNSRECPYCREIYDPLPCIGEDSNFLQQFNKIPKKYKNICQSMDYCENIGLPMFDNLCMKHYEKQIVKQYIDMEDIYIQVRQLNAHDQYGVCNQFCKNGFQCSKPTKVIYNGKRYCSVHFKKLEKELHPDKDEDEDEEYDHSKDTIISELFDTCSATSQYFENSKMCCSKIYIPAGELKLCKHHFLAKLKKDYQDLHLAEFYEKLNKLFQHKKSIVKNICKGIRPGTREKCLNKVTIPGSICNEYHTCYKPGYLKRVCRWVHPVTKSRCERSCYDQTQYCAKHTGILDQSVFTQ